MSFRIGIFELKDGTELKSIFPTLTLLVLVSIFLIGGCNNSGSGTVDARRIGDLSGTIVEALNAELNIRPWREGVDESDIFLNGNSVSTLSAQEIQALNDTYDAGFMIALIDPINQNVLNLLDLLERNVIYDDNGQVDLVAVASEFNVRGIRFYTILPVDGGIDERLNRERVERLIDWQFADNFITTSTHMEEGEEGSDSETDLTKLANSTSNTTLFTVPHSLRVPGTEFLSDFEGHFQLLSQAWSLHSIDLDKDFYFFQTSLELSPNTTSRSSTSSSPDQWPCNPHIGSIVANDSLKGVVDYSFNNTSPSFSAPEVENVESKPLTTEGEVTTESAISRTISGEASYEGGEEGGPAVGVGTDIEYEQSREYSSPAITTINLSLDGPNGNNAEWEFKVLGSNAQTATFQPVTQWYWEASESTRSSNSMKVESRIDIKFYAVSCLDGNAPVTLTYSVGHSYPIPPLPPSN